jgi:hypothetical protein
MRVPIYLLIALVLSTLASPAAPQDENRSTFAPKILSSQSAYFEDQTGVAAVGEKASSRLRKWGRFKIVQDREEADLIILLSADPYKGGYIVYSGGQTGTIDKNGNIQEESTPYFNRLAPVRYAYLTVIDPKTGESLWSESRRWGGLLTGFNSAGERLVGELEKQVKKQ